ncbi:MAG: serine/threonine-protein kinase [Planctomycetota bacterium]
MDDAELIDELLDRWEEAQEAGDPVSPEELCADHPHLLETLQHQLERLQQLDRVLEPGDVTAKSVPPTRDADDGGVEVHTRFDNFRLLDQGGLGVVYSAEDQSLGREVAVKFLQQRHLSVPVLVSRFRDEAEITGRLDHPGIVPIYGFGCAADGQPYYVMRRIHGDTLDAKARAFHQAQRTGPDARIHHRQLLASFVAVCRAIMYAHRRGVVHADLKPKNIVLGKHGETIVLDWGLAAAIGKDEHHQNTDEATLRLREASDSGSTGAGTWGYMSPEQHTGLPVNTSTDIYALGATLYFILTGKPAFDPKLSPAKLREQISRGRFPSTREVDPQISPQLDAICQKAMALVPAERYRTADELGDDLERFFADEPVSAYAETIVSQGLRWLRHHRNVALMVIAAATLLITTLTATSAISTYYASREHRALMLAERARNRGLTLAAQFAADLVSRQMVERWNVLQLVAADSTLIEQMQANSRPSQAEMRELSNRLADITREYNELVGDPVRWFACSATGQQIASVPVVPATLGRWSAGEDFFHGLGSEAPEVDVDAPRHITAPHRSQPFREDEQGPLQIALTVPIWAPADEAPDRQFLGVLGISVSFGAFHELPLHLRAGERIMVVDLGEHFWEDQRHSGLLLAHPEMERGKVYPLDQSLAAELKSQTGPHWLTDFQDPVTPGGREWIAATCPVQFPTDDQFSTWVVIVSESYQDER